MNEIVWKKSTRSGDGANCVEVAVLPYQVLVRDSKNRDGGALALDLHEWRTFVAAVTHGDFTP